MKNTLIKWITLSVLILAAPAALAHTGIHETSGLIAGLLHPLTGMDHLLAMLAVGIWAAYSGKRARWVLPSAFVALMVIGGTMALGGLTLPLAESVILLSVVALGLMLALGVSLPALPAAMLVGFFGVFHGYAHGLEVAATLSAYSYVFGFAVATMALHFAGILIGMRLLRLEAPAYQLIGGAVASSGLVMALLS